jgi:hypothetical protein
MRLRTIDTYILLALGILLIARSTWGIVKDSHVDISTSESIYGVVAQTKIKRVKENTLKLTKYKSVFILQLEGIDKKFAVDRGTSIGSFLDRQIHKGDSIIIYYKSNADEYDVDVLQIEKNNTVVIDVKEYRNIKSRMIYIGLLFGVFLTSGIIFWMVKQNKKNFEFTICLQHE